MTSAIVLSSSSSGTSGNRRRQWPDSPVRTLTTRRPPAEALLDASRNATLLVLGPGAVPVDTPFASVIHDVLLNINAPVLVARPGR
jgi:hypothetical protein